jgi:hypothetical protein
VSLTVLIRAVGRKLTDIECDYIYNAHIKNRLEKLLTHEIPAYMNRITEFLQQGS